MKPIAKNELFKSLSGFLKSKGIELTDGSYSKGIQQSCSLLTRAINLGQESLEKAKVEVDKTCDHVKQVIHDKTAPKPPRQNARSAAEPPRRPAAKPPRSAQRKPRKPAKGPR